MGIPCGILSVQLCTCRQTLMLTQYCSGSQGERHISFINKLSHLLDFFPANGQSLQISYELILRRWQFIRILIPNIGYITRMHMLIHQIQWAYYTYTPTTRTPKGKASTYQFVLPLLPHLPCNDISAAVKWQNFLRIVHFVIKVPNFVLQKIIV